MDIGRLTQTHDTLAYRVIVSPEVVDVDDTLAYILNIAAPLHGRPDLLCKASKQRFPAHCEMVAAS